MWPNNSPEKICVTFTSIGQIYGWIDSSRVIQKSEEEKRREERIGEERREEERKKEKDETRCGQ